MLSRLGLRWKWSLLGAMLALAVLAPFGIVNTSANGGASFGHRQDKVKICHYDRNNKGPNAGPHIIRISEHAVDKHLENHTRTNDYTGDDFVIETKEDRDNCRDQDRETTLVIMKECTGGVTGGSFDVAISGDMSDSLTLGCDTSTDPIVVEPDANLVVSETTTGYDTSYRGACDGDGSVILEEAVENTCVVSNAELTTLTIEKVCGNGVTSAEGPFNFELAGTINDTFSIAECDGTYVVEGINANDTGILTETNDGFDVAYRGDCDGDGSLVLVANQDNVCVVTNTATTLVITKECAEGVTGPFDVALSGDLTDTFNLECDASTEAIIVNPAANLVVSETTTGYDTSYRGACDGDGSVLLEANVENTCVVHNDILTTLTIQKVCGEGVTTEDGPFNFELAGSINDTFSIDECDGTHEVEGVNANDTGLLTETDADSFAVSYGDACDTDGNLILTANQANVCTVTNDPLGATTLVIVKECTGGVTGGSFDVAISGDLSDSLTLGCDTSADPIVVEPDANLVVSETTTGYDTSYRGACDGDGSVILEEGVENTCVVSNAELITLTITKECGEGVTSDDGPFSFELAGSINDTFSIDECGGSHAVEGVVATDTGILSETDADGFDVAYRGDCDGDGSLALVPNQDNVCVVTNNTVAAATNNNVSNNNVSNESNNEEENTDQTNQNQSVNEVQGTSNEIPTLVLSSNAQEQQSATLSASPSEDPESAVLGVGGLPAAGNGGSGGPGLFSLQVLGLAGLSLATLVFGFVTRQGLRR